MTQKELKFIHQLIMSCDSKAVTGTQIAYQDDPLDFRWEIYLLHRYVSYVRSWLLGRTIPNERITETRNFLVSQDSELWNFVADALAKNNPTLLQP